VIAATLMTIDLHCRSWHELLYLVHSSNHHVFFVFGKLCGPRKLTCMMLMCNVIVKAAWIEAVDDDDGHY
jgi:hypothetical protein